MLGYILNFILSFIKKHVDEKISNKVDVIEKYHRDSKNNVTDKEILISDYFTCNSTFY